MTMLVRFTLGFMLVFMALFLIALVLIQRGRGGGLAGAFGGAGGQSAFGTKAGDLFTRITVVAAAIWIVLCIVATNVLGTKTSRLSPALGGAAAVPGETGEGPTMEPAEPETKPAAEVEKSADDAGAAGATTEQGGSNADALARPAAETKANPAAEKQSATDEPATTAKPSPPAAE
jgi:preprotein translocase subunit SecG